MIPQWKNQIQKGSPIFFLNMIWWWTKYGTYIYFKTQCILFNLNFNEKLELWNIFNWTQKILLSFLWLRIQIYIFESYIHTKILILMKIYKPTIKDTLLVYHKNKLFGSENQKKVYKLCFEWNSIVKIFIHTLGWIWRHTKHL